MGKIPNPRLEKEKHYYNAKNNGLRKLGLTNEEIRERVNDVVELIETLTPREEIVEGNRQAGRSARLLVSGFFTDLTTGLTFRRVDMQDQERVSSVEEIEAQRRRPEPTPEAPLQAGPELRAEAREAEAFAKLT